jgi:hypothetical protein
MLQDLNHMEVSRVLYVKVGTIVQLKQCKICVLTGIAVRIVMLFVRYDLIVSVYFM